MARKPATSTTRKPRASRAKAPAVVEVEAGSAAPAADTRAGIDTPTGGFSTDPRHNPKPDSPAKAEKQADAAAAEVQAKVDKAEEQGYFGETSDPHPNEAYSLLTGPDAPPVNPPRP